MTVNSKDREASPGGEHLCQTDCKVWEENTAGKYGDNCASFAHQTTVSICAAGKNFTNISERNDSIKDYESGKPMIIHLQVEDDIGQGPAIGKNDQHVIANISSNDTLFDGFREILISDSDAEISITGHAKPGEYSLYITFEEEGLDSYNVTVEVKECEINHERSEDETLCSPCSSSTFNFFPKTDQSCRPCPEDGDCTSNFILPNKGCWNKIPCSEHIHRCLTSRACDREDRREKLENLTEPLTNCEFTETWIKNYTETQCREV